MTPINAPTPLENRPAVAGFQSYFAFAIPYLPALLTALGLVCGIALRTLAYTADHSLWIDECMLALNIVERSPAQLLEPLGHNQGAPVGFLLACKASVEVFGVNEAALRLPAFVGSIVGLFAFAFAAFQLLPKPAARLALWFFALSPYLVAYAAEAKQYSTDGAVCGILLALAAGPLTARTGLGRWIALALGGAAAIWCSHPSMFLLAGLGIALFVQALRGRERKAILAVVFVGAVWVISFAAAYVVSLRHLGENKYLQDYWVEYFLKFPPRPADAGWILDKLGQFFVYPGGMAKIAALPALLGIVSFARRPQGLFLVAALLVPFAVCLIASALQKYPFGGRLLIFAVPILILLVAHGLAEIAEMVGKTSRLAVGLVIVFPLFAAAGDAREQLQHPKHPEEMKSVLNSLQRQWQPGDHLYVYGGTGDAGAGPAFEFYSPQFQFPPEAIILGGIHRGESLRYLDEVRALPPGGRIWLLVSHEHRDEVTSLRSYFDTIRKRGPEIVRTGSAAYAYDARSQHNE